MIKPFYDLVVVGGGFAGFGAAVQSARLGLTTLLIENRADFGGSAQAAKHTFLCGLYLSGPDLTNSILNPGLSNELADILISHHGAAIVKTGKVTVLAYEPSSLTQLFRELAGAETRLDLLFGAAVDQVTVAANQIKGLRVRHQGQQRFVECGAVLDCSGRGDVIMLSGASYEISPVEARQLAACAFPIKGVQDDGELLNLKVAYHLAQAAKEGPLPPSLRFSVWLPGLRHDGQGILRMSVLPRDSAYDLPVLQKQADQILSVLKKKLPEFKNSEMSVSEPQVVEREGLRMVGRYTLTKEDVLSARKFADGAVKCAWPVEFWDQKLGPRYDYVPDGDYYEIPSRSLQSKDFPNLFAAGRCFSADPQALASARVTGTCLALGEQAAHAARAYLQDSRLPHSKYLAVNIVNLIREETKNDRARPALLQKELKISYGSLLDETEKLAQLLKSFPVKKYARVGILVSEGIDYVILNLAVLSLQAVIVPIPQSSSKDEIEQICTDIRLDLLVYDETSLYSACHESHSFSSPLEHQLFRVVCFDQPMKEQAEFEALNPAFIRFTSGTTGQSKGVVISHEAIDSRTQAADQALQITHDDVIAWVLSMSYHFLVTTLLFLRRSATIMLCDPEIPRGLIEGIATGTVTFIYATPFHYHAMSHAAAIQPKQCSNVRMAVSTTTHLNAQTAENFLNKFGFELTTAYGVIELGLPLVNNSRSPEKRQSVGQLVAGYECRLAQVDKDGVGIVQIKGPGLFSAYFLPWKRIEQITTAGWFETGDLGRWDDDGFLFLLGRHQQVINFMGMKIFPREVEEVLLQNQAVEQAYVYGEDHPMYGQLPCAKIVLQGHSYQFDEDSLRKFCYTRLVSYKVPKKFECVQSFKRTKSGKIKIDQ